ncbi:MAG TPA: hypothetical protein QGH28_08050, partial [Chloroflexota bacterium]|nr:hypothetical protein [Chloroflexota bacterium]
HGVVAVTGVAYLYMRYIMTATDPFAVINHPWQPAVLSLHIVAAPVFIGLFGMLFRSHTLQKLLSPNVGNRRTGWMSLISFSTMALTGYLLQVAANPMWVSAMVWAHVSTSLIFVVGYSVHLVIGWRLNRVSPISPREFRRAARIPL